MWEKFKQRLGKTVQGLLNIFKKKPKCERGLRAKCNFLEDAGGFELAEGKWTIQGQPIDVKFCDLGPSASDTSLIGKEVMLNDGELFIDGVSFGKVLKIDKLDLPDSFFEKTDKPAELNCDLTWEDTQIDIDKVLKNLVNTYESLLPKRIHVPTLIVSTYASWDYDSIGIDISQLEEKGIAHFFCTSTKSMEEHMTQFRERHPDYEEWEEDDEGASVIVRDATLIDWGDGIWTWE